MSLFEENAAILRDMNADGSDLGPTRLIDFSHIFADRVLAEAFARDAARIGFTVDLRRSDGQEEPWDVTASKEMPPTCENITHAEERLGDLARSHQGRADGWGFFRV